MIGDSELSRPADEQLGFGHASSGARRTGRSQGHANGVTETLVARLIGIGGLVATGGIHLDLYLTGYHAIPTIGVLFLLQVATAFLLAAVLTLTASALASAAAAGFVLSTIGGYTLSRFVGIFGFKEVPTTAGLVAGIVETATVAALGFLVVRGLTARAAITTATGGTGRSPSPSSPAALGIIRSGVPVVVVGALVLSLVSGIGSAPTTSHHPVVVSGSSVVTIKIVNFAFVPPTVTVRPGVEIVVTNDDSVTHTLTAQSSASGSPAFSTGNISPGSSAMFKAPLKSGSYPYLCSIHNFMMGTVVVSS
jgi:plastocyanin